jgi:hypothetical protein
MEGLVMRPRTLQVICRHRDSGEQLSQEVADNLAGYLKATWYNPVMLHQMVSKGNVGGGEKGLICTSRRMVVPDWGLLPMSAAGLHGGDVAAPGATNPICMTCGHFFAQECRCDAMNAHNLAPVDTQ